MFPDGSFFFGGRPLFLGEGRLGDAFLFFPAVFTTLKENSGDGLLGLEVDALGELLPPGNDRSGEGLLCACLEVDALEELRPPKKDRSGEGLLRDGLEVEALEVWSPPKKDRSGEGLLRDGLEVEALEVLSPPKKDRSGEGRLRDGLEVEALEVLSPPKKDRSGEGLLRDGLEVEALEVLSPPKKDRSGEGLLRDGLEVEALEVLSPPKKDRSGEGLLRDGLEVEALEVLSPPKKDRRWQWEITKENVEVCSVGADGDWRALKCMIFQTIKASPNHAWQWYKAEKHIFLLCARPDTHWEQIGLLIPSVVLPMGKKFVASRDSLPEDYEIERTVLTAFKMAKTLAICVGLVKKSSPHCAIQPISAAEMEIRDGDVVNEIPDVIENLCMVSRGCLGLKTYNPDNVPLRRSVKIMP
ncbi:hypothetical protein ONE63_011538 [Megalurothrips usitatus]|uniref:Uncharacterized protein n=1 Tax=Megalurothrips usitatus TaxID=439358 RepID=A0AAV7X483_9NEOP|nr:hypothetical protein ONE63_011538 [Megalurothrips usitatus]